MSQSSNLILGGCPYFDSEDRLTENFFLLRKGSVHYLIRLFPFAVFEVAPANLPEALEMASATASEVRETFPFSYYQPLLILATTCSLSCRYCYALDGTYGLSASLMSEEVIHSTMGFLRAKMFEFYGPRARPGGTYEIGVICFGGEPLIALDGIHSCHQQLVVLCSELSDRYRAVFRPLLTINTNAYDISDDARSFLISASEHLEVVISFDGWTHDSYRVTKTGQATSDQVLKNALQLKREGVDVAITACIMPEAVSAPTRTLNSFDAILSEQLPLNLSFIRGPLEQVKGRAIYPAFAERGYQGESLDEFGDAVAARILAGAPIYSRRFRRRLFEGGYKYRCGAGLFEFAVAPNGDVYPCHNFVSPEFRVGNIRDGGFNLERSPLVQALADRHVGKLQPCSACVLQSTCMSSFDCPAHSLQDLGDLSAVDTRFCGFARRVQLALLSRMIDEYVHHEYS
jgi:uncharacterized protein